MVYTLALTDVEIEIKIILLYIKSFCYFSMTKNRLIMLYQNFCLRFKNNVMNKEHLHILSVVSYSRGNTASKYYA